MNGPTHGIASFWDLQMVSQCAKEVPAIFQRSLCRAFIGHNQLQKVETLRKYGVIHYVIVHVDHYNRPDIRQVLTRFDNMPRNGCVIIALNQQTLGTQGVALI